MFVCANYPPTICGVGDYTFKLANALVSKGIRCSVLSQKQNSAPESSKVEMSQPVRRWNLWGWPQLVQSIDKVNPDIIHLQYEAFSFNQSFFLPLFLAMQKKPLVSTLHEVWHKNKIHFVRDRFLYQNSQALIVNDQGCFERLLKIDSTAAQRTSKIGVGSNMPPIPSAAVASSRRHMNSQFIKIGYFGFINLIKQIDIILESLHEIVFEHGVQAHLKIIAKFEPEINPVHGDLQKLILKLNLQDNVTFTGELAASDVSLSIESCDFMILPFIDGASPRRGSFQACMQLGRPVITTRPQYHEEFFIEDETAVFIPKVTKGAVTESMMRLIRDPVLCNVLKKGAVEFSQHFTWSKIADQHLAIYEAIS
jgi:glycosyltransferase involved in cell wall biosynthesis